MAKIGSKEWFLEAWDDCYKEEMKQYDPSSKDDELKFSHTIYNQIKNDCHVGILHRKEERLKIKDELIELFTNVILQSIDYFIENKQNFSAHDDGNLENIKKMLANSEANRFLTGKNKQYLIAIYTILNILLDEDVIKKIRSNKAEKDDLLIEILQDGDAVISSISEIMSAHLYFNQPFPEKWSTIDQLDTTSSKNPVLDGRLYQPSTFHCWIVNLSWMMAHLHKGNDFIIYSTVDEKNLLRKTKGHEGALSGFAKEITLAKKIGYHIEIEDGTIFMKATEEIKVKCQNLVFEDVRMSDDEVKQKYNEIALEIHEAINRKNSFVPSSQEDREMKSETMTKKREQSTSYFHQPIDPKPKKRKMGKEEEEEQIDVNQPSVGDTHRTLSK